VWKALVVGACFAAALFSSPNIALSQSAELDSISSLVERGKLEEAEPRLQHYLQTHPRSVRASDLLGTVYLRQGHFEQAKASLQKAIASAPTLLGPRIKLGDACLAAGRLDSALAAYEDAAKIGPTDVRVHVALAKLYLGNGEFAKSIEAAAKIPERKRTGELLPTLAADYLGLNQPDKAGVEIQAILEVADRQPELVLELAEFFLYHRDFKSSQQLLTAAHKQPVSDRLQIDLALTQAGMGQLDQAQSTLESVLEHAPDSVAALVAAGQVASQQLNWAAAEEAFSRASSLSPDRPDILYGLVSAQLRTHQTEGALENARRLHSLLPDDLRSTYLFALALFGARKGDEAKPYAEQVLATHPEDREMHLLLADVALNSEHDLPGARKHADICLKQNPTDPGALYYLGMVQKMEGDLNGAIQSLSRSVAGNPKNADAQGTLGAISLLASDVPGAIRALEQAVLLAPDEAQNHYHLALAYSRAGAPDRSKAQMELYQQLKAKVVKDDQRLRTPPTSEVPSVKIPSQL
jgi:tetratricopeptide (TPR) repeat protein